MKPLVEQGAVLKGPFESLLDIVYPRNCIGCGGPVEGRRLRYVCGRCESSIHRVMPPHCGICGYPILGSVEEGRTCPRCIELDPVFRSGHTLILHRGVGREIIRRLKYHGASYLLPDIERFIRECPWFADFTENAVLVPVPLHARRLRERGFNQSLLLAERFAEVGRSLEVRELLVRVKDTKSQINLTRTQRQDNIRNAFELVEKATLQKDRCHVVIDDVFTTGATLNACSRVLRRAGIRDLRILTLAHG